MATEFSLAREEESRTRQTKKNKSLLTLSKHEFFRDLIKFHETRGTPIVRFPKISGLSEIDLYKLYDLVISRGGWMKVNSKNEWSEIEKEIGFPEKCVNSELALKHIYIRYFDKYERVNFLGEEKERIDEDEDENRHKRWSARALHSIPQSYNHNHHNITSSMREANKLSTNLYQASEYDKLAMSLLSPLPNEQDFAINVLTLMSNECKQTLRLHKCPRLIGILLAHAGCFEHSNLREMFNEFYSTVRGNSIEAFWKDLLSDKPDLFYLIYDDVLNNEEGDLKKAIHDLPSKELQEYNFLGLGRQIGTQDYIGQRVHQVMTIIRNLSFFEENIAILASDKTLIRFLVMSANVRWNNLHMMALDVLGNICSDVILKDPFADLVSRHLFGLVCDEIESRDRATIIAAMEVLSKLCTKEDNEEFLLKHLKKENYKSTSIYLLVPDMMLLVYTLECIYSLTSLGEKACNCFVEIHGFMDTLVSLITIEAQSLGPDSCIQMKVIETVPTRQLLRPANVIPQNVIIQKGNIPDQQRALYQSPQKIASDVVIKQNQQQHMQESEQFALAWIKNNFELSPSLMVKIEEHDMYRMYLNACTKIGRKGVISQVHFPRIVRSIFGVSVGPNGNNNNNNDTSSGEKQLNYYCGIKPRAMTLPTSSTTAEGVKTEFQVSVKSEDSALTAQLNAKTTLGQSLLQQALSTSQSIPSTQSPATTSSAGGVSSPTTSTSLIKSLLANKVTFTETNTSTTTVVMSMPSTCVSTNVTTSLHNQVAQRQQITQNKKLLTEQLNASSMASTTSAKIIVTSTPSVVKTLSMNTSMKSSGIITTNANENKHVVVTQSGPPPLAPLSTQSNKAPTIITINPNSQDGKVLVSPKLSANKMLVDLLDKKASEPQFVTIKRKADSETEVPAKKVELDSSSSEHGVSPSSKAADLYAKLAGSILEDEDMEDEDEIEKALPAKIIEKKMIEVKTSGGGSQMINTGQVQRQIIMGPNNQVILSPNATHQTTATIKTDSGIQSVPIIIQQPNPIIQQQSQPTQYILATNQQGQTYVVAQQPINNPPMPQTVLLAQAPGQQGQKTIIILQQPQGGQQTIQMGQQSQQQKIIMTPSGQQVIYSSSSVHRHIQPTLLQQSPNTQMIQNASQATNRKIVITNASHQQNQQQTKIVQHATSQQTLQAIAQGQNIIMQKGQKYQIGSTQITQIVNPVQQQQPQQQVSNLMTQKVISTPVTTQSAQVMIAKESAPSNIIVKQSSESPVIETQSTPPETPTQQEQKHEETTDDIKEEIEKDIKAPSSQASSSSSSGTSSPAPTKQTISIQIPVPQSQIAGQNAQQYTIKIVPSMDPSVKVKDEDVELSWPYTCEWRGCPKKKFSSANEVYLHACAIHCPSLEGNPDLFCQWGGGNTLCDNLPRKRFSLMTHVLDRHCTNDALKISTQKRVAAAESGTAQQPVQKQPYPVTLYRQPNSNAVPGENGVSQNAAGMAAMQAIKRHSVDFMHLKDAALQDEVEGTVTKSIRLTAALILRNLASYSNSAKRSLRYHEAHLSQIALSNLESNRVIAQVLYEINEQISPFSRP